MARTRGISEQIVWLYNPCPDITERELLERAKLENIEASDLSPFEIRWKYGGVLETEWLVLRPGEQHGVRKSEAAEFMEEFGEQGMVTLSAHPDVEEARTKAVKGLQQALKFWKDRGGKRAMEYRKKNALSRDDMEEYRYDLWAYYLNEEKAKAIEAEIRRLQNGGTPNGWGDAKVVSQDDTPTPKPAKAPKKR